MATSSRLHATATPGRPGALHAVRPFTRFTTSGVVWEDGSETPVDAVGFRPALNPLTSLGVVNAEGKVSVDGTRSILEPRLWLVGYGEWTGFASATLVGVMRGARRTAQDIGEALGSAQSAPERGDD